MKKTYQAFGYLLCMVTRAPADPLPANPGVSTTSTFIPQSLEVPAFVPPTPKPAAEIPPMRVDAVVTAPSETNHTLTILRGEASTLPDLPVPQDSKTQPRLQLAPEKAAKIETEENHTLQLGAIIYDHRVSRVHWQRADTGEAYEALCGFDISLLQGIGQFTQDGETYYLILFPSCVETAERSSDAERLNPDLAEVPRGSITYLKGNPNNPGGTATITLIRDLIANENSRLTVYQADRLRYQQAAGTWKKDHPPVPRDETIWLRPHRGSHYLPDTAPKVDAK